MPSTFLFFATKWSIHLMIYIQAVNSPVGTSEII